MKNASLAENERAEKDLSELLGQDVPSGDLDDLFSTKPGNFLAEAENKSKNHKPDHSASSQKVVVNSQQHVDEVKEKDDEVSGKRWEPKLKNPEQKYQILDSSDEELEQDTKDSINLAGRRLQSVPTLATDEARRVKNLTLTNNQITNWDKLSTFTSLETLVLDKNGLKSLAALPTIETLKTLWLNNNQIEDFELILHEIKSLFPNLEYLSVLRNPINPAIYFGRENEKPYYRFRRRILQELPNLKVIDTQDVTPKEREDARRQPKFLVSSPLFEEDDFNEQDDQERNRKPSYYDEKSAPAAFIGKGKIKYDGRESEGNRFITNTDL